MRSFLISLIVAICALTIPAQASDRQVVAAVNEIRTAHGLPKLKLHSSLQGAAEFQSVTMAKAGKMAHTAKRGVSFQYRLKRFRYRGLAAENIARGQPNLARVLSGWMNSRGHRKNILHPRMRYFGLAAAERDGRKYWTMVLGG